MTLIEVLQFKLNKLNENYESELGKSSKEESAQINEDKKMVVKFLNDLEDDIGNIRYFDLDNLCAFLKRNSNDPSFDPNKYKNELRIINLVFEGKFTKSLKVDLSANQRKFLDDFFKRIEKINDSLDEKINEETERRKRVEAIQDDIIAFELLSEKVRDKNNVDLLTVEDFNVFYKIIEDPSISNDIKKEALINFRQYNESDHNKKTVNIDSVKSCFKEFNVKEEVYDLIDAYAKGVTSTADLDNIREVLSCLSTKTIEDFPIINRFSPISLLTVALYGNKDSIEKQFERMHNMGRFDQAFFETASVWINNLSSQVIRKNGYKSGPSSSTHGDLQRYAREISYEEMLENESFLTEKGFDVSIKNKKNLLTLKTPHYKVVENYETLQNYGLFRDRSMSQFIPCALSFSLVADKCDNLIELGLLHGTGSVDASYANYTYRYPSIIKTINNDNITVGYYLKDSESQDEYYNKLFSQKKFGTLKPEFLGNNFGYSSEEVELLRQKYFIDQSKPEYIPNASSYDDVIRLAAPNSYDKSILEMPEIKKLEENNRVPENEYVYMFGNQVISRLKVLRCYSALQQCKEVVKDDALLYCISRGTCLRQETFDKIKSDISLGEKQGGKGNELSKKI